MTSSRDDPVDFLDPLIYSAETLDGATHGGSAHGTTNFGPLCHAFLSQWQDLVAIRGVIATICTFGCDRQNFCHANYFVAVSAKIVAISKCYRNQW